MDIDQIYHLIMILAIPSAMSDLEKYFLTRELMKGFNNSDEETGVLVTGR